MKRWLAAVLVGACTLSAAPAPAPAPAVSIKGDVQFRLEYDYAIKKSSTGADSLKAGDYTNKYAWNLFIKANPFENVMIGLRLSNPMGYNLDNISDNINWVSAGNTAPLTIPEAYLKWTVGMFWLSGGIIPVIGNTVLDLVQFEHKNYVMPEGLCYPGFWPWAVGMNNSMKGLNVGLNMYTTPEFSIAAEAIATIDEDAPGIKNNWYVMKEFRRQKLGFTVSIPMSVMEKKFTAMPVIHVRTNMFRDTTTNQSMDTTWSHSFTGGLDLTVKPVAQFAGRAGFAAGGFKYKEYSAGRAVHNPFAMQINAGVTINPGFGSGLVDYSFGMTSDLEDTTDLARNLNYFDIKYLIPVKNITMIPRIRIWTWGNSKNDQAITQIRPELNLKVGF
jgi:hypothetical protein